VWSLTKKNFFAANFIKLYVFLAAATDTFFLSQKIGVLSFLAKAAQFTIVSSCRTAA